MKSRDRIFCALSVLIVAQVVVMVSQLKSFGSIQRIDKTTQEHTVVLASHSTKIDAILDFGLSNETLRKVKEHYDRLKP